MGINTMCREFLEKYDLPFTLREDFKKAMDRLAEEKVDIFLGNHMQHNNTPERYQRLMAGDKDAFVDQTTWSEYAVWAKNNLIRMEEQEKNS